MSKLSCMIVVLSSLAISSHVFGQCCETIVSDVWYDAPLVVESVEWPAYETVVQHDAIVEDEVSDELCKKLRAAKQLVDLPLQVRPQVVELDCAADDVDQGRMDIAFIPMVPDESINFALECKRVNARQADNKTRRYFSKYVIQGLMRFVTGQYSQAVRHGGMLAFVLDGDVDGALKGVLKNIVDKSEQLQLVKNEVLPSRYVPNHTNVRETTHSRSVAAGDVLVHHLFMPVKSVA